MRGLELPASPILAFDTSTDLGSLAVRVGDSVAARRFLTRRSRQAAELIPSVGEALAELGLAPGDLGGIVVGRGPGSFTGVRIAAATAQGLAAALRVPLWTASSLAAGAASHGAFWPGHDEAERGELPEVVEAGPADPADDGDLADPPTRLVLFDARSDRLYAGAWRMGGGRIEERLAPQALTLDQLLDLELPSDLVICGDGAHRHAGPLEAAGFRILPEPAGIPLAEGLLRLLELPGGVRRELAGHPWEPDYLRPSQPEREAAVGAHGLSA